MTKTSDRITQVTLESESELGVIQEVYWIESRFARVGRRVLDEEGTIWTVAEVYGSKDVSDLDGQYSAWRQFQEKLGL